MHAICLLSGGVDSSTCLGIVVDKYGKENVVALSIEYGQKHQFKELKAAYRVADYYEVRHECLNLTKVFEYSNCSLLLKSTDKVPEGSYAEQQVESGNERVSTAVPFRNGVFLACVAAFAQSIYPDEEVEVFIGAHSDDAAGNAYADCSIEFTEAMSNAIFIGTYRKVKLVAPLVKWNKAQVVSEGLRLKVPYHLTTSCYNGGEKACGLCGTCLDRAEAFRANGVIDPIQYAADIDWAGCNKIEYLEDKYPEGV